MVFCQSKIKCHTAAYLYIILPISSTGCLTGNRLGGERKFLPTLHLTDLTVVLDIFTLITCNFDSIAPVLTHRSILGMF